MILITTALKNSAECAMFVMFVCHALHMIANVNR